MKVVSHSVRPHGLHSPWNSPGQNTGVDSHSLLQGIFPTQGLNPGLPHCRWILYQLSHKGTPYRGKNNSNDPDFSSEIMDTDIQKGANIQNIQKKFVQLNRKRPCNPILKWTNNLNRHFFKEDRQIVNRYMQRCSASLIIKEIMRKKKKREKEDCGKDVKKREPLYNVGGNVYWYSHYSMEATQENKNRTTTWSSNPTSWYIFKGSKTVISKRYLYPHVHHSIIYNSQGMETIEVPFKI